MFEYAISMFHSIVAFVFIVSTILLFLLAITLKKKVPKYKTVLLRILKVYSIFVLGLLVVFGVELILGGIRQVLNGESGINRYLQIGGGLSFIVAAGVAFYIYFIARIRALRKLERRKKEYPDAPWMWVDKWLERKIVYSSTGTLVLVWFVILVVISGIVFVSYMNRAIILAKMQGSSRFEVIAFSLLMLFIFVPGLMMAVSWTRGQLKYGKSIFEMSTYPGIVGGELAGTIYTQMRDIPKDGFKVELLCELIDNLKASGAGRTLSPTPVPIWRSEKKVLLQELKMRPEGVSIPVSFSIPPNAEESDEWSPDKRIDWMLCAFSSRKGRQYLSQFIVPIFKPRSKP